MVAVNLDINREQQLQQLASAQGRAIGELAQQIIEDHLDLQSLAELTDEQWAKGCIALAPEVFPEENWDEEAHP